MPLKLAYALTIHKSQGMTLDAIEIDIGNDIFAAGQAYTDHCHLKINICMVMK
jgi:ATP-dependent DNA helicase PIF1